MTELLRIVQIYTSYIPTHICMIVDLFLFSFFFKQPMNTESLKGNTALYHPLQRSISLDNFPLTYIKSKTTTHLKILVLVYSKKRAFKLKCFRGNTDCHKTIMKISHIVHHHPLRKWKEENAICDLRHQADCRRYDCHLPHI